MTVINSRTRGLAPMMMGKLKRRGSNHDFSSDELVEGEDGELYRLEVGNGKIFTKPRPDSIKGNTKVEGKAEPTKNVFAVGAMAHQTRLQSKD